MDKLKYLYIFYAPRRFVRPSDRSSYFYPEHISKSIEGNLIKLDTLIEGYKGNRRMQEP